MLRPSIEQLPASLIREVANAGMGRSDVLRFWFGEGDQATPEFIRAAAKAALDEGDTFYNHNLGLMSLRCAIAQYVSGLHQCHMQPERVAVTSAGVSGLAMVSQALIEPGDRAVIVTPVWPNLTAQPRILGAQVINVPLRNQRGLWTLDLQQLLDAAQPGTRMVVVNSPNNPTGWVMPQTQWNELRAHCAQHGIWLVSDDAYERLIYEPAQVEHAPGVLSVVEADERFISVNTFSKAWSMTGWRLGWLIAPTKFIDSFGKLIEFNTSCAPPFVQRAGVVALRDGEPFVQQTRQRLKHARNLLVAQLGRLPNVEIASPAGAMYLFFRLPGISDDSLAFTKRLVLEAGLGLAPGIAFGGEGEGNLRWCFAASEPLIERGVERLEDFLQKQ